MSFVQREGLGTGAVRIYSLINSTMVSLHLALYRVKVDGWVGSQLGTSIPYATPRAQPSARPWQHIVSICLFGTCNIQL